MTDFLELALRRQSCRSFSDRPVEHEKLVNCVEAARLAPSGCNSQPWRFVVVETPEKVKEVAERCFPFAGWATQATAFIIVLEEHAVLMPQLRKMADSQIFAKGDLGAAAEHICLEAETQGLAACHIGIFDREALSEILGLPVEQRYAIAIALGYAKDPTVRAKDRKPLGEIVKFI